MEHVIKSPPDRNSFKQLINDNKDKGIVVKAHAKWCKPCKQITPYVYSFFNQLDTSQKLLIDLDIDECKDVASYLRIRGVPTTLTYKNGDPCQVVIGANPKQIHSLFVKTFT